MHIGFLTPEYPYDGVQYSAGIGTSLKNLSDSLMDQGCRVSVFVYNQSYFDYIQQGQLTLHLMSNVHIGSLSWFKNRRQINKYVQYFISTQQINLIEVPDWTGISAFMRFSCPLVMRLHGSDGLFCFLEKRKQKLKNYFFEKIAIRSADYIISPNRFTIDITKRVFGSVSDKKVNIINLGLDLNSFLNPNLEDFEPFTVYCIGTIIRKKGVFFLPHIFQEILNILPNTRFYFIGNDSRDVFSGSESTWSLLVQQFSPVVLKSITYLGKIDYSEVSSHLRKANLCVFPSMAETTGMVTLEAMAMSKAVITSNEVWSSEIITQSVDGYRLDPSDYKHFANIAVKILTNQKLAMDLGKNARLKIESDFDAYNSALKNIKFYRQIIQS